MELGLKGKIALITGSSSGIGLAIARGLAAEKVNLILCARNGQRLEACAQQIRAKQGVEVLPLAADLSRADEIDRVIHKTEEKFSGLDILINNAGIGSNETILDAPDEEWQYYWDLHVMAAMRLARCAVPLMRHQGGGVILHNASINAKQPSPTEPIYNVTKAALVMFSKCLANELIHENIRVNCVNPGMILTDGWILPAQKETTGTGIRWQERLEQIARENAPIGRFASPEELADFFVFLCSERASYCVGSEYYVDGGWLQVVA